jgi:hypothetical protein
MSVDESRRILHDITSRFSTRLDGPLTENGGEIEWKYNNGTALLDGHFSADELEAIAVWMREHYDGGEP